MMAGRTRALLVACLTAGAAWAQGGPVILSGEDPDQALTPSIHCGGFGCDGLYGSFLRCLIRNASDPTPADPADPAKILIVGATTTDEACVGAGNPAESYCGVRQMIDAAATLPASNCGDPVPQPEVTVVNDAEIDAADFSLYTVIIIPSTGTNMGQGVSVTGGIDCSEIDRLAARTGEDLSDGTTMSVATFVNKLGRGLMAFAERGEDPPPTGISGCENAFSFLPGCFTFGYPPGFDQVTETSELEDFGMELPVDGLDHLAYHTTWTGPVTGTDPGTGRITQIAGLDVLAYKAEEPHRFEPVIIGGRQSTIGVCSAGGPYTGQCGSGNISLALDGSGSVATGGVSWSTDCPGSFVPGTENTLTPTLEISGMSSCQADCTVTLTVIDECGMADTCTSTVTIGDTTPPELVVPPPLLLECSAPGGVPGTDAAVLSWLASASATDGCGDAAVTNDAPALFPAGCPPAGATTVVTFTASDGCGNQTTGPSTVTVVDSLPPMFVTQPDLGRNGCAFLWPPMHGYADFSVDDTGAVAVDVCTGVALQYSACGSSQPEDKNGIGDGESRGDCTVSEDFQELSLRAERDGACAPLDRSYAMAQDATDSCGNYATSLPFSMCVYHDQGHHPPNTGPTYMAQPDSNQNDVRHGYNGSYGPGCGGGCSLVCDPTQALP